METIKNRNDIVLTSMKSVQTTLLETTSLTALKTLYMLVVCHNFVFEVSSKFFLDYVLPRNAGSFLLLFSRSFVKRGMLGSCAKFQYHSSILSSYQNINQEVTSKQTTFLVYASNHPY